MIAVAPVAVEVDEEQREALTPDEDAVMARWCDPDRADRLSADEVQSAWSEREPDVIYDDGTVWHSHQPSPFGPPRDALLHGWSPEDKRRIQAELVAARSRSSGAPLAAVTHAPPASSGHDLLVTSLDSVTIRPTRWFWPHRIPNGAITLLAGDGGLGKGTFAYMLASWATTGAESLPRGPVLILSGEDTPEEDIKPKLLAYGGDPTMVSVVHAPFGNTELEEQLVRATGHSVEMRTTVKLPEDIPSLAKTVEIVRPVLVIVDPLNSHIGQGKNTNAAEDMASVLVPLDGIAKAFELAVLVIDHVGKADRDHHVDKVLGSVQKRNTARSVLIVEEGTSDDERLVFHEKANRGRKASTLSFELKEQTVTEGMQQVPTVIAEVTGTTSKTYDELREDRRSRSKQKHDLAVAWAMEKFENASKHKAKELEEEVKTLGFSWRTAKDAFREIGVSYTLEKPLASQPGVGYWVRGVSALFPARDNPADVSASAADPATGESETVEL